MTIHSWGIKESVAKTHIAASIIYGSDYVEIDGLFLGNFSSDCGAVCLSQLRNVTEEALANVLTYCKLSGYSVIISTVVGKDVVDQRKILEKAGFVCVNSGESHRTPSKEHHVYVLRIPEEQFTYKGYMRAQK